MIDFFHLLTPGLWFVVAGLLMPFVSAKYRTGFSIFVSLLGLLSVLTLQVGQLSEWNFLGQKLILLRADVLTKIFGTVFCLSALGAFIYAAYTKCAIQYVSAFLYIGSALGVVFAGDLLTLYMFWEVMAVASVVLILSRKTERALSASKRYILVHIVGGLILLMGILFHFHDTGSLIFNSFQTPSLGAWLILIGFLINAAAVPFSSWLPDAYPEATIMGSVILSAYTTKTAVYTLLRGFPGWSILIWLGAIMAIYGIIYALIENNIRRLLSYSIVNQVGFMLVAIGIGTPLAISGAAGHAFSHIIYKGLLMMVAGAVIYRTGKEKFSELGGLAKSMPWTMGVAIVGAFTISAFPFTSSFVSKSLIMSAVESTHSVGTWLVLEIAAASEVIACSLPFIYFIFFGKKQKGTVLDAPLSMKLGMGMLATICVLIGLFPNLLYEQLPDAQFIISRFGGNFVDMYLHHPAKVLTKIQMLSFSALVFFLFLPYLKRRDKISLDFDWFYRKGSVVVYRGVSLVLNGLNSKLDGLVRVRFITYLSHVFKDAPVRLILFVLRLVWRVRYDNEAQLEAKTQVVRTQLLTNTSPLGYSCAWVLFGLMVFKLLS